MKVPCKDCPNRQVGCHSTCEKYIEYKKESDRLREERRVRCEANQFIREENERKYKRTKNYKRR